MVFSWQDIVSTLLIAVATSYLTVRLSLRQFYSQKWWESKAEAYSGVIDSLSQMKRATEVWMDFEMMHRDMPDERRQELRRQWAEASAELQRRTDVGTFILSPAAVAILNKLEKDLDKARGPQSSFEGLELEYVALRDSLERIRQIGRQDLNVDWWKRWLNRGRRFSGRGASN